MQIHELYAKMVIMSWGGCIRGAKEGEKEKTSMEKDKEDDDNTALLVSKTQLMEHDNPRGLRCLHSSCNLVD